MQDLAKSRALELLEGGELRCVSLFPASRGAFPTELVSHLC